MQAQPALFEEKEAPATPEKLGAACIGIRPGSKALAIPRGAVADFDYTLNPYVGCGFGCGYCFAANFVADEDKRRDWGRWVDIKIDAVHQIAKADLRGKRVFMSSATDPYQPLEARIGLTRRILETLLPAQPELVVQTRSPLVTRDLDLLTRFDRCAVNMSVTTDSETVRRAFEPGCPSIQRRLDALAEASFSGIPVTVCIAPMLPIEDTAAFADRILAVRPAAVVAKPFDRSERPFAASTRPEALELAASHGWNQEAYRRTLKELCRYLPMLRPWSEVSSPVRQNPSLERRMA